MRRTRTPAGAGRCRPPAGLASVAAACLLCSAATALGYPKLESRLEVRVSSAGPDGVGYMTFFQDHEDPRAFWWAPLRLELARVPGRRGPWLKWTAHAEVPRLSFALEMTQLGFAEQELAKRDLAAQVHSAPGDLSLKVLSFEKISLQAQETSGSPFLFSGEWRPVTSLFPWIISETIALPPEQNDLLLRAAASGSPVPIALNVSAEFLGYLEPKRFVRAYVPACVAAQLRGKRDDEQLLAMRWSPLKLYSVKYAIENNCVTRTSAFGAAPMLEERMADWDRELVRLGLLRRDGDAFRIVSTHAIDGFQGPPRHLDSTYPERLDVFQAAFGVFITQLRVSGE
ncbi:hypothetical protein [Sorangium sp. So ce542]|uniref:hypothetical protein n=1 Tax=Sorangium sp. So ce542 TaxID=3133316 RepID=UPI003F62AEBB